MTTQSDYIAQLLGQPALPTESSGRGAWGAYESDINGDQLRQLQELMGYTPPPAFMGGPNLLGNGGYIPLAGTPGGIRAEQAGADGNYRLAYTPNAEGTNMALHQSDIAGSKNTDMLGTMIVGGILGAGALGLGGAGTGQYATVSEALAAGDYAAADAMAAAAFDAGGGISGLGSSLGSGAGGLIEGVNAFSYNGQLIPYGEVALDAAPGFSMSEGAGSLLERLGSSAASLFGGSGGGAGLTAADLFKLAKTGTGIYSVLNANKSAGKTNDWQQGQVPQGTNFDLSPTMPGGALGKIAGMTPQNWQSKIGYADGGEVVRPGMDKPSIIGFLQYLYNSKKLPSELAQEKQKKREADMLQRGISEVSSPTNALDRRMKEMNLKGGGPLSLVRGPGAGQDDAIPARLSDGEYVFDADTVSALGDGSTDAGAAKLDAMRERIRTHKRKAPPKKIPPKAKDPMAYLGGK